MAYSISYRFEPLYLGGNVIGLGNTQIATLSSFFSGAMMLLCLWEDGLRTDSASGQVWFGARHTCSGLSLNAAWQGIPPPLHRRVDSLRRGRFAAQPCLQLPHLKSGSAQDARNCIRSLLHEPWTDIAPCALCRRAVVECGQPEGAIRRAAHCQCGD